MEKKITLVFSVALAVLLITLAVSQTIIAKGFHPALIIFWAMAIISIALVRELLKEYKQLNNK